MTYVWDGWRSVAEGQSTPGAPVTAVRTDDGRVAVFLADPGGGIFAAVGSYEQGWGQWCPVAEGQSTPGAPVTAVPVGDGQVALFLANPSGSIFTAIGSYDQGWGDGWRSVAEGQSTPGAPVTAVRTDDGRVAVFLADPGGGIFAAVGSYEQGWGQWCPVAEGQSTPGAPVTAVAPRLLGPIPIYGDPIPGNDEPPSDGGQSGQQPGTVPGPVVKGYRPPPTPLPGPLFIADLDGGIYATTAASVAKSRVGKPLDETRPKPHADLPRTGKNPTA